MYVLVAHIEKSSLGARYGRRHQLGLLQPVVQLREQNAVELLVLQLVADHLDESI